MPLFLLSPPNAFCGKGCILKDSGRNVSQSRRCMRAGVIFPTAFWILETHTHTQGCSILRSPLFFLPFQSVSAPFHSKYFCWFTLVHVTVLEVAQNALPRERERLDQLGAVSHLITRCKWNGYTCLIFSGSRNVRLARDGIKQHCQRKWTQGFLSYFTSYWVTVTIYFTAVGRLVWKCSAMPLRMEGESRKRCEGYCSHEALCLFLRSVTKLYCLNKALLFMRIFFLNSSDGILLDRTLIKHKSESWQTHSVVKVILCTLDDWCTDLPREGFGLTNPDDPYPYQMCHPGHTKKARGISSSVALPSAMFLIAQRNYAQKQQNVLSAKKMSSWILHSCHRTPIHIIIHRAEAS